MKITAFIGSARKGHSWKAARQLMEGLQQYGDIEYELVNLFDCHLEICRGCKLCTDRGEELCPLKDDRDRLIDKIRSSDGVVFISPNYTFQVSGMMKVFLDRLAFLCHRPEFFGKTFTSIVPQGIFGGNKIVRYLDFIAAPMGFSIVKGICFTTLEPISDKNRRDRNRKIEALAKRFSGQLMKKGYPAPSLFDLIMFRFSRTKIRTMQDETFRDYSYYREKGWFESDYFYQVKLGPLKRLLGRMADTSVAKSSERSG